jgi:hypothetical protein
MKPREADPRAMTPVRGTLRLRAPFVILCLLILALLYQPASAQQPDAGPVVNPAPLTAEQVVHNLALMNLHRAQALHAYQGTRTYRVQYHGFPGTRDAEMVVIVKYLSPGQKEFVIQSATGSKLIVDKVLKKLLEAEKEESRPGMERRFALTEANYHFSLIGYEGTRSGSAYVLSVEPRRKDTFLYRGRIWVNAEDFAVERLDAEPAKNPSFWTKNTDIVLVYTKVRNFWLPANNHSITAIRLGGRADLTIDYKDYRITDASQVISLSMTQSALRAESDHAPK